MGSDVMKGHITLRTAIDPIGMPERRGKRDWERKREVAHTNQQGKQAGVHSNSIYANSA